MNSLKQIFAFTFVFMVVCLYSCNDKPGNNNGSLSMCEEHPAMCKSVIEAKDFFLFKLGSYWVYEEETTHARDSLYVTGYANDENGYDFFVEIKSSLTDYVYRYWPFYSNQVDGCSPNQPVYKKCIYIYRSKGKFQDDLGETVVFFLNYKQYDSLYTVGDINYCTDSRIKVEELYNEFPVAGTTFQNVVKINESCSFQEGKQPANIYYSKNVGIIRKELIDSNQVWNLVNYYVIQ